MGGLDGLEPTAGSGVSHQSSPGSAMRMVVVRGRPTTVPSSAKPVSTTVGNSVLICASVGRGRRRPVDTDRRGPAHPGLDLDGERGRLRGGEPPAPDGEAGGPSGASGRPRGSSGGRRARSPSATRCRRSRARTATGGLGHDLVQATRRPLGDRDGTSRSARARGRRSGAGTVGPAGPWSRLHDAARSGHASSRRRNAACDACVPGGGGHEGARRRASSMPMLITSAPRGDSGGGKPDHASAARSPSLLRRRQSSGRRRRADRRLHLGVEHRGGERREPVVARRIAHPARRTARPRPVHQDRRGGKALGHRSRTWRRTCRTSGPITTRAPQVEQRSAIATTSSVGAPPKSCIAPREGRGSGVGSSVGRFGRSGG